MRRRAYGFLASVMVFSLLTELMPVKNSEAANVPKLKTKKLTLTKGQVKSIKIKGKRIKSKKFKSTKKAVATVSKKGKVKAKKVGTCKIHITVKYRKTKKAKKISVKKLTCTVKVKKELLRPKLELNDLFVRQVANTSIRMLQINAAKPMQDKKNVLISPESVMTAMAMVVNGANGETLTEMKQSLYGDISVSDFNHNMSNYNDYLTRSKVVQFHLANSIWVRKGLSVKKSFLDTNQNYYHAQTFTEPFNENTKTKINNWVNKNTKKMIPAILDKNISKDDLMYLVNALAFEGRWRDQYSDYQVKKEAFTDANGNKQTVNFLNSTEHIFLEDDKATGIVKPYEGGEFAFVGILPKDGVSVSDYVKAMTGEAFIRLIKSAQSKRVITKIPEFSYDYQTDMEETMKEMGISKAFTPKADFSNMMTKAAYIDSILHKTHIELDRNGTKAAAVTAVRMAKSSAPVEPPKEVYLNRPFIYAIVEMKEGLPVFMGVVHSVK